MSFNAIRHYYYRGGQGYSAEYQAVLDRATALGYTQPSSAQKTKQNTLIQSLKDAGIWTLLDVFYVFATDGSSDFATLNWKTPSSYSITKVLNPTFTLNEGFRSSGGGSYLDTGWIPSIDGVNYTLNSASYGIYIFNNAQNNSFDCGTIGSAGVPSRTFASTRTLTDASQFNINSTGSLAPSVTDSSGLFHVQRPTSSTSKITRNGVSISTTATSAQSLSDKSFFIAAVNNNGTPGTPVTNRTYSAFFTGTNMNGLESALYTELSNYLISL